ncbi:MAG: DUF4329 domain-containing protein [Defluviitaleaceae bacterium]|nr:DUF4329 domain-containing protein [Defluviitaleaceae bacterium]
MHNPVRFIDPTGLFSYEYEGTGNCPIFTGQSSATIGITNGHSSISWSFSGGDVYKDISTINAPVPPGASWDICWGTTDIPIGSGPLDLTSLLFPTLEIAVHVWAIVHHPHSEGGEWVAWITRDTAGRYGFSEPNWALGNMVPVPPWDSDAMYPLVRVALIHTHPTPGGSGHFSVVDANAARANEMPNFLVTPYGNVNRIYPGFRILYGETSGRVDENHEHWDMVSRVITDIFRGQRR